MLSFVQTFIGSRMPSTSPSTEDEDKSKPTQPFYAPFRLPITYLPKQNVFDLSTVVSNDMELATSLNGEKTMYEHMLQPKHDFAKRMIGEWNRHYTNHVPYLEDTQSVIREVDQYRTRMGAESVVDCEKVMEVWADTKENAFFLEKYGYIEWDMLKHLNQSPGFLQTLTVVNMSSPAMSLVTPILFLIFPFLLLKIQRVPITFTVYLDVLKSIARNHFIGKAITSMESISFDKIIYLISTFGLYLYQVYQNMLTCMRFYKNINKVNDYLCVMREYTDHSIRSMETFVSLHGTKPHYRAFCQDIVQQSIELRKLYVDLASVRPFQESLSSKIAEVGYLLRCYYEIHSNIVYERALRYSVGFEGYINNLIGIHTHISANNMGFATFIQDDGKPALKGVYYPPHHDNDSRVKNNCEFDKNVVLTGPNAAGKTTMLKSTTMAVLFTQQVGCGFYREFVMRPYTHIHSYLNIPDTSGRDSLFQAESRRCKEIIDVICANPESTGFRHFCIFDELYSGTNPTEAGKAARAFLQYLAKFGHVDYMLTTHYVSVCSKLAKDEGARMRNYKMDVAESDADGKLTYTYKMKRGISRIQGAIRVLEDLQYPSEIIEAVKRG